TLFDAWEVAAKPSHCRKDCKQDIKNCLGLVPPNKNCTGTKAEKKACRKNYATQRKTCRGLPKLCKQQNPNTSGVCLLSSTTTTTTTLASPIFAENFDSYPLGAFPSSGGWQLIYAGLGSSYQHVDNTQFVSPSQSLHLVGSSCWSGTAYHPVALPPQVILEGS